MLIIALRRGDAMFEVNARHKLDSRTDENNPICCEDFGKHHGALAHEEHKMNTLQYC